MKPDRPRSPSPIDGPPWHEQRKVAAFTRICTLGRLIGAGGMVGTWLSIAVVGDRIALNLIAALLGASVCLVLARRDGAI